MCPVRGTPELQSPVTRPTRVTSYRVGSSPRFPIVSRAMAPRDTEIQWVRTMRRIHILVLFASAMLSTQPLSAQKRPFDVDALLRIKRIIEPQISPDGKWVAF